MIWPRFLDKIEARFYNAASLLKKLKGWLGLIYKLICFSSEQQSLKHNLCGQKVKSMLQ